MLFVPLPLFATLFLGLLFIRFVLTRDMRLRAHQLFALLVALYAVQSLLSSLRWGYEIEGAALFAILMAPILPAVAYLAYKTLSGPQLLWPLPVVLVNWLVFAVAPDASDAMILMTYIGFGILLLRQARRGVDHLSLSPINDTREILIAMYLTGTALIASGLTDVYLIYDFVRNEGQNAGLVLTFVQTVFALAIGVSGVFGKAAPQTTEMTRPSTPASPGTQVDDDIIAKLEDLFTNQKLHRNEDLSLRSLSRRLGLPDRQVSNAINRQRQMSVSQFVNTFRIQDACQMLKSTDRSVLDVSLAAGFATKSNFNREFLRITGQSPSQWRSNFRRPE
ncbi:helix-turn-helix domain-containing protein [Loktanella agnita]|uniref:helix-turn-helix domain-containing protein n=1 Tax=Loktanella agnita TaxID=287097 RepID=UPI003988DB36